MTKIGFALTASYCTIKKVLEQLKLLKEHGYDIVPIASPNTVNIDTRFMKGTDLIKELEDLTGSNVLTGIVEIEPLGPSNELSALVIAPATGNTIAKIATGISDTSVTMAAKISQRNRKPTIIGVSTNDALGLNNKNIKLLQHTKNFYFIPYSRDNPVEKPNSLVAHFDLLLPTLDAALEGSQIKPIEIKDQKTFKKAH